MGLSDKERITGIIYSIKRIRTHVNNIKLYSKDDYYKKDLKELFALSDKLWHSFLQKSTNNLHWLLGSSASSTLQTDDNSLWANIVRSHLPKLDYDKDDFMEEEPERKESFNLFHGYLDISGLISNKYISEVYKIYLELETLSYYTRRYNDLLLENLDNLNTLISDLFGSCFEFMEGKEEYAKAYVLNKVLEIIYNQKFFLFEEGTKLDSVDTVLKDLNLHHHFHRAMGKDIKFIAKIHIKLDKLNREKSKELLLQRLLCAIELCGGIEYDHMNQKIIEVCKKDAILKPHISKIQKFLNEWSAKRKTEKESDSESYSKEHNDLNQLRYSTYRY